MENNILIDDKFKRNFVKAFTIKERLNILKKYENVDDIDDIYIKRWRERKSLISEESFLMKLREEQISKSQFNCGIKELTDEEVNILSSHLEENDWFIEFRDIFNLFNEIDFKVRQDLKNYDLSYIIRPFIYYVKNKVCKYMPKLHNIRFSEEVMTDILSAFGTEVIKIIQKSFIIELHRDKNVEEIEGENSSDRFKYFLKSKFTSSENLIEFYSKYAALTRVILVRTDYYINNTIDSIDRLNKNFESINKELDLKLKTNKIVKINQSQGDSHQKGKSVSQFIFEDGTKIIYKPKNLKVEKTYYELIEFFNKNTNLLKLPKIKGFYQDEFTFEECVEYQGCTSEKQIENFYERFGETIAIIYMLCGTDFHFENVIASGENPYLIDMETLFQNKSQIKYDQNLNNIILEAQGYIYNSVLDTALMPSISFNNNGKQKGVDISGLNGDKYKMPKKVLVPVNVATDNMRYEYKEVIVSGAKNIPMLNNEKVKFQKYISFINKGFKSVLLDIMKNKEVILKDDGIIQKFKGKLVRCVIKSTQRYAELLNYSVHPSCAKNFIEREKLFENMWGYPHKNKNVVRYEVNDMLFHDVPIFYTRCDSRNLWSSTGEVIENFYSISGYERVIDRIKNLDLKEIDRELSYMTVAFDKYDECANRILKDKNDKFNSISSELNIDVPISYIEESMKVGDDLLNKAIYSEDKKMLTWIDVIMNLKNQKDEVTPIKIDFYNGLSGIAMYYYYLYKVTKADKYKEVYKMIIDTVLNNGSIKEMLSPFWGRCSLLHFLLLLYKDEHKYLNRINEIYDYIEKNLENESLPIDWLSGSAGLIQEVLNTYDLLGDDKYLKIADKLGKDMLAKLGKKEKTELLGGMSHGASGMSFILFRLWSYLKKDKYKDMAIELLEFDRSLFDKHKNGWIDKRKEPYDVAYNWCNGSIGIAMSRIMMSKYYKDSTMKKEIELAVEYTENRIKNDDCLCHGNMGDIDFLLLCKKYVPEIQIDTLIEDKLKNIFLYKKYYGDFRVKSLPELKAVGLFTGLCGIGYELLRVAFPDEVPSVLTLDI